MDMPAVPQGWANAAFTAFGAMCLWLFRKHDKKLDAISEDYVTRADLERAMAHRDAQTQAMHLDNSGNFREIRQRLDGVNANLIDLAGRK